MSGSALQHLFDVVDDLARRVDRGALRQRQIDEQFGAVRAWERTAAARTACRREQQRTARPCRRSPHTCCAARDRAMLWKARAKRDGSWPWPLSLSGRMKTPVSGVNSTATNQEAISAIADDGEQREAILAGAARREADRNEAGDGDERARQHREGRGGVGEGRSGDFVGALLELGDHHLHGDHGVVDEKPEPDDQRAERDALQADAGQSS